MKSMKFKALVLGLAVHCSQSFAFVPYTFTKAASKTILHSVHQKQVDDIRREIETELNLEHHEHKKNDKVKGVWGRETTVQHDAHYWESRYHQVVNRLAHDRHHHKQRLHELEQKIHHLQAKIDKSHHHPISTLRIEGEVVPVSHAQAKVEALLRQRDDTIRSLNNKVSNKKRRNIFRWLLRLPRRTVTKLQPLFGKARDETEMTKKKDRDLYENHEDVYMEY